MTKKNAVRGKYRNAGANPPDDLFVRLCRSQLGVQCVRELQFHPKRKWRFDYAFPAYKIALEVEGGVWTEGRHTRPKGFLGDIDKYNTATVMGWRILRTTPEGLLKADTLRMLRAAMCAGSSACADIGQNGQNMPENVQKAGEKE